MHAVGSSRRLRRAFVAVAVFSAFSHLLNLASPLFIMHVYDRVLSTRSGSTLLLLAVIFSFMLIIAGVLDFVRGRVLNRLANGVEVELIPRLADRMFGRTQVSRQQDLPLEELQSVRMAVTGAPGGALLDAPWSAIYVLLAFLLHPVLGWVALASAGVIGLLIWIAQRQHLSRHTRLRQTQAESIAILRDYGAKADLARALGVHGEIADRWTHQRHVELAQMTVVTDQSVLMGAISKTVRLLVQIVILGAAAWLAIRQELTAGAIFAASIIVGRALLPLEVVASSWQVFARGFAAWRNLSALDVAKGEALHSRFEGRVEEIAATGIYAGASASGRPYLKEVSFRLRPGEPFVVAGGVGCGKSLLLRVVASAMPPVAGTLRINGLDAAGIDRAGYARTVGFLPQLPEFFPGSIAENVACFRPQATVEAVVGAVRAVGMHEMVCALPQGYETALAASGLSVGQMQLLSLARAFVGEPSLLILDTPETALDPDSLSHIEALLQAASERGVLLLIATHHPRFMQLASSVAIMVEGRFVRVMSGEEFFRRTSGMSADVRPFSGKRE